MIQYYDGAQCEGALTTNYGYRNGACVYQGPTGSLRVVFDNSDCGSTVAISFSDRYCQVPTQYFQLGALTVCTTNTTQANTYLWSYNLNCVLNTTTLPVYMDSVLFSYRPSGNCSAPITAFQSVATDVCLATDSLDSFELDCPASGTMYTESSYTGSSQCSSGATTIPYNASCPAVGLGFTSGRRLAELLSTMAQETAEARVDRDPLSLTKKARLEMHDSAILEYKREIAATTITEESSVEHEFAFGGHRMHTETVLFSCVPYSASNTASATQNYVNCTIPVTTAGTYFISVCPVYGGSYSADPYLVLRCQRQDRLMHQL